MSTQAHTDQPDQQGADTLGVTLLCAVALTPLATSFHGALWWLTAAIALLVGIALVSASTSRPWGAFALPVGALVAFILVGYPAVSMRTGFMVLVPDRGSLNRLAAAAVSCWGDLINTLPRVDATGPVLLIPLILGLVASTASLALARYTRAIIWPIVPPLVVLQVTFLLGRDDVAQWAYGLAFAVVAFGWAAIRRPRSSHTEHRGRSMIPMAVALLLGCLLVGVIVPVLPHEARPTVLRTTHGDGIDTSDVPSLLTGFRRYTEQPAGTVDNVYRRKLLTLTGAPAGTRMRFAVLDHYNGVEWRPSPDDRFLRIGSTLDNPTDGTAVGIRVRVNRGWRSPWVPTAGALQTMSFDYRAGTPDPRDDIGYSPQLMAALLPHALTPGSVYYFDAVLPDDTLKEGMEAAELTDEEQYRQAQFVDDVAAYFFGNSGWEKTTALIKAARLFKRTGRYSDGGSGWEQAFSDGHDVERLDTLFLRAPQKVGNDEQYAAVMALVALRLRMPARVVVGAKVPKNGVIRGNDVEAWVEVQMADGSWRVLDTSRFMGSRAPNRKKLNDPPNEMVVLPPPPPGAQDDREADNESEQSDDAATNDSGPAGGVVGKGLGVLLALLLAGAVPLAKVLRRRWRRTMGSPAVRVARGWQELLDTGSDFRHDVPAARPRPDQARALGVPAGVAVLADDLTLGMREPDDDDARRFWEQVDGERDTLAAAASRWARIRAWLNPRTLWRRWHRR